MSAMNAEFRNNVECTRYRLRALDDDPMMASASFLAWTRAMGIARGFLRRLSIAP